MSWRELWQLIFPRRCVGCQTAGHDLCPECSAACTPADPGSGPADLALYTYRDPKVRQAIWLLKYKGVKSLARQFSQTLYLNLAEELAEWKSLYAVDGACLVVPIPSSAKRRHARGFNQASEIARALTSHDPENLIFTDVLIKTRETPTQVSVRERKQRLANLVGAFTVKDGDRIAGQPIIIIDDVTTTGATFGEARRALKLAGAGAILSLALARG